MKKFTELKVGQVVTCSVDGQDYEVVGKGTKEQPIVLRKVGTTNVYRPSLWKDVMFWPWKENAK